MSTRDYAHTSLQRPAPCTLAISGFLRSKSRNIDLRERMGVSPLYSGRTVREKKILRHCATEPFQLRSLFDALTNRKTVRLPPRLDGSKTTSTRLLATASPHVGGLQLCTQFSLNVLLCADTQPKRWKRKKVSTNLAESFLQRGWPGRETTRLWPDHTNFTQRSQKQKTLQHQETEKREEGLRARASEGFGRVSREKNHNHPTHIITQTDRPLPFPMAVVAASITLFCVR